MSDMSAAATIDDHRDPDPASTPGAVVVGCVGPQSQHVVEYAAAEAAALGRRLTLAMVLPRLQSVPSGASREADSGRWGALLDAREEVAAHRPWLDIRVDVQVGDATERLVARAREHDELVVGRDLGDSSTTWAVLDGAAVPVTVVPDGWLPDPADRRPVLIALHEEDSAVAPEAVAFARERAQRYGVPLRFLTSTGHAPDETLALLESSNAQLVVLTRPRGSSCYRPGSLVRLVVQRVAVPVSVVPG